MAQYVWDGAKEECCLCGKWTDKDSLYCSSCEKKN